LWRSVIVARQLNEEASKAARHSSNWSKGGWW
jgi:hypothetical protein